MQLQSLDAQAGYVCLGRISGPLIGPHWEDEGDRDGDSDEQKKKEKDDEAKPPDAIAPGE